MSRWTFHGGRLAEARATYGDGREPWLDLSTGINPMPWPGAVSLAIDWSRLPDEQALRDLEAAAAAYFGVAVDHVCALPGTEIGLRLLDVPIAAHVGPAYRTHAAIAPRMIADLADAAGDVLLANPNNPDGRLLDTATLDARLARGGWLAIDEAFADTHPEASMAGRIADERQLVIFRSFGKYFGLAGVRLGFVLGPRALIARYREKLGSWPLSSAALAIGTAAYRDHGWIEATRARLPVQAAALDGVLRRHGLTPTGACPLFRLVDTQDAAALFERLARRAILTRPFDHDPRWLRFGLPGNAAALARLDRALGDG